MNLTVQNNSVNYFASLLDICYIYVYGFPPIWAKAQKPYNEAAFLM